MTALWAFELAERFWTAAGARSAAGAARFPRDLRRAVVFALPLAVVELPNLRLVTVRGWLVRRGIALPSRSAGHDRPLRACLLAREGAGLVCLDRTDPPDEQRFSLAHEAAHFLADYLLPRRRVAEASGPAALAALDGQRPPTSAERVDAVLAGVPLGLHLHLMERTPDGHPAHSAVSLAERRADTLALELLAPQDAVRAALPSAASQTDAAALLVGHFGLPATPARAYAARLVPPGAAADSFLARLGLAASNSGPAAGNTP